MYIYCIYQYTYKYRYIFLYRWLFGGETFPGGGTAYDSSNSRSTLLWHSSSIASLSLYIYIICMYIYLYLYVSG